MISYDNQCAFKLDGFEGKLRDGYAINNYGIDPLLDMKYVSPVNQGRFETIGQLETGVSLIQATQKNVEKISFWLQEIGNFIHDINGSRTPATVPKSVINKYIGDRLALVEDLASNASFQGRKLLNGDCGIKAEVIGENLRFVRGSARVLSSQESGYAVAVYQAPKPSILTGHSQLMQNEIDREELIYLSDDIQEIKYKIKKDETAESLVKHLREFLLDQNLDIEVFRTGDNRLFFRHNQLGSKIRFRGMSYKTRIISSHPGQYEFSMPGVDIAGTIGSESAHGDGGFLVGDRNNKHTDGLVFFYDGAVDYPGQVVGHVHVKQNGITVPLEPSCKTVEMLSIPSIKPELLAVGLTTRSGFSDLASINTDNETEQKDALKMVLWSIVYLDYLSKELKQKENDYVNRTIQLLKGSMVNSSVREDEFYLSKEKAGAMVEQIKEMLG